MQQKRSNRLRRPVARRAPVGYRNPRPGRDEVGPQPIFAIAGAEDPDDDDDDDDDPDDDTPKYSKKDLSYRLQREKAQGERKATRKIMEELGFDTMDEARDYVKEQREAKEQKKSDAERAAEEAKTEKDKAAKERREAAQERRTTRIESALVRLGVDTGDEDDDEDEGDLPDAVVLLARDLDDDADVTDIRAAAKKLKERRPELFAKTSTSEDPKRKRGNLPSGAPGRRKTPEGVKPGAAGRDYAKKRGWITDTKD